MANEQSAKVVEGRFGPRLDPYLAKLEPLMQRWARGEDVELEEIEKASGIEFKRIWPRIGKWLLSHRGVKAIMRDHKVHLLTAEEQVKQQPARRIKQATRAAARGHREVIAVAPQDLDARLLATREWHADITLRLMGVGNGCTKEIRFSLSGKPRLADGK